MDCDLLIENVSIFDGPGSEPYTGRVAVRGDRIEAVGENSSAARMVMDGRGFALAPGFIDVHAHDDLYLLRSPADAPEALAGCDHRHNRQLRNQCRTSHTQARIPRSNEPARTGERVSLSAVSRLFKSS